MHFDRNNWQFKPISKKMENSMSEVIHECEDFAYWRPNRKKWNRHSKKCDCAHFQKGQTRRSGCMSVPFVNFLTECLCFFCDFNILFVCTWLQNISTTTNFLRFNKTCNLSSKLHQKIRVHCSKNTQTKSNPSQN